MKNKTDFPGLPILFIALCIMFASSCDKEKNDNIPPLYTSSFTDPRDGNVYQSIRIGNQIWMAENLKYLPAVVGPATDSQTTPYYYVYGYDGTNPDYAMAAVNYDIYGVIYNWAAAITACPAGWHLPSHKEWHELVDSLGIYAGDKLKASGTIEKGTGLWYHPNLATNETAFSALPGGYRHYNGLFTKLGYGGYWWSACEDRNSVGIIVPYAWRRAMFNDSSYLVQSTLSKEEGFSVRCLKD